MGFFDIGYHYDNQCVCTSCYMKKIEAKKQGEKTEQQANHLTADRTVEEFVPLSAEQREKLMYSAIQQIAGDIRFIKNYILFNIALGVIGALIAVISLL